MDRLALKDLQDGLESVDHKVKLAHRDRQVNQQNEAILDYLGLQER